MDKRIGVYICHCGGNISDYVDVEEVRKSIENDNNVVLAKTTMFACSDANQKDMVDDINENNLSGVIVASCSPKLHLVTFRNVTERAKLNKYTYVHANIREQASWAHSDNGPGATKKTIQLVKSALAKARNSEPLKPSVIESQRSIAVIGAGIAGMKAALTLSDKDCHVYLIEKEPFVGGRVAQWNSLFISKETGKSIIDRLYRDIKSRDNITVFTNTELISNKGSVGDFEITVKVKPRYIKPDFHPEGLKKAIEICPVEVPDKFNFRMNKHKAIYKNYPSQFPKIPVIDRNYCNECRKCETVCEAIDLNQQEQNQVFRVGSVLMATGFDPYTPEYGEFGYATAENVITLPQFKRLIDEQNDILTYKNKKIKNIAYIYCVGSRQVEGDNKYCSRYCCTSTIHAAITAHEKFPNTQNFHFTRGIRSYGKQELIYADSRKNGDVYLQSYEDNLPQVLHKKNKTTVKINDILTNGKEISVDVDLVVLVTGMVPRNNELLNTQFKLPQGRDKFYNEVHMKLRPVETVVDGITIAGACQGPKSITETVNSALSAATKSFSFVSKGTIETDPLVAKINQDDCNYCNICSDICPFEAIEKENKDGKDVAKINSTLCKGCGMCTPVCPTDAIDLIVHSNETIMSMIDALV